MSSHLVDKVDKDKSVMEDYTASKKNKTSRPQKTSLSLIPKTKRQQKKDSGQGECSDSDPEETIELSLDLVSKLEKAHELNIQSRKKYQKKDVPVEQILEEPTTSRKEIPSQYKEPSPYSIPKYHFPRSER
jgi:hypothetical protein